MSCAWPGITSIDGRMETINIGTGGLVDANIVGGTLHAIKTAGVFGGGPDSASASLIVPTNADEAFFAVAGTYSFRFSFLTDAPDAALGQIGGSVRFQVAAQFAGFTVYIVHGNDGLWTDGGTNDGAYVLAGPGATGDLGPWDTGRLTSGIVPISVDIFGNCTVTIAGVPHTFQPSGMTPTCLGIGEDANVNYVDDVVAQDATYNWVTEISGVSFTAAPGQPPPPWCPRCRCLPWNGVGAPTPNQPIRDELLGLGDGSTTVFYTAWPYTPQTLEVEVDGEGEDVDPTDYLARQLTMLTPPGPGLEVVASYRRARFA